MKTAGSSLVIFGVALLSAGAAFADIPLTLSNASFEIANPFDQSNNCSPSTLDCYNNSIVDWNQFGGESGTFDPTLNTPAYAPPALNGNNVAFLNSGAAGGSYITQDLGILAAGTYDITIAVASRGPLYADSSPSLYRLGVDTGGTAAAPTFNPATLAQISGSAPLNPTLSSDDWSTVTLTFTANGTGDYYTFISADGAAGGGAAQLEVDAVAAPEPSALLLLAGMVMLVAAFVRTKRFRVV